MRKWLWLVVWAVLVGILAGRGAAPARAQSAAFPCSEAEAQALFLQLQQLRHLTLVATEDRINGCLMQHRGAWQQQGIRSLSVDFHPKAIEVYLRRGWFGVTVRLRPYIQEGRVYVDIDSVRMGFFPLPRSVWQPYQERLARSLARMYAQPVFQHLYVRALDLDENGFRMELSWR